MVDIGRVRELVAAIADHTAGPARPALTAQAAAITAVDGPVTMVELTVDPTAPTAAVADGPLATTPTVLGADGNPIGELLLWVTDGRVSTLEHPWWTDEVPVELPDPDRLTFA